MNFRSVLECYEIFFYGLMDSVMIIIFNKTRQKLVLVKQFRNAQLVASIKEENPGFDFTDKCEYRYW